MRLVKVRGWSPFAAMLVAWVAIALYSMDSLCLPMVMVYLVYLILSLSLSPSLSPSPSLPLLHSHSLRPTSLPCWLPAHRQTAPYGLGNPPRRRRRSLPGRCECSSSRDLACATFCHQRPW